MNVNALDEAMFLARQKSSGISAQPDAPLAPPTRPPGTPTPP